MAERRFALSSRTEGEELATAFFRFLEIHSRTLVGSEKVCGISTLVENAETVKVVRLWSDHAISEFVLFWNDYRRVYGRHPAMNPVTQPSSPPSPAA